MSISLKNPLRYTAADHSVLCVCTFLLSPSRSITFVYSTISLLGQHSDCQALSQVQRSLIHTLSLSLCHSASVTSRHPHKFIEWELFSLDIKIFVYFLLCCTHTHTLTHSLPLTHPRLLLLLPINFCCSCFRRRSALTTRRRCLLAHVLRLLCVCVCVLAVVVAVVVVASSSWLLRRRRRRARVVVVCKVVCVQISTLFEGRPLPILLLRSLSLSLCVFFLIRLLSPCLSPALRVLFCLILVAGWRLECGLMYRLKTNDVH